MKTLNLVRRFSPLTHFLKVNLKKNTRDKELSCGHHTCHWNGKPGLKNEYTGSQLGRHQQGEERSIPAMDEKCEEVEMLRTESLMMAFQAIWQLGEYQSESYCCNYWKTIQTCLSQKGILFVCLFILYNWKPRGRTGFRRSSEWLLFFPHLWAHILLCKGHSQPTSLLRVIKWLPPATKARPFQIHIL